MARASSLLAVVAAVIAASGACRLDDVLPPPTGSVDFGFIDTGNIVITSVDYTISGNGITPIEGTISVGDPEATPSAIVGGIPAGSQYQLEMRATTVDGQQQCLGTASFDVKAGEAATVMITLTCSSSTMAHTIVVNGMTDYCPWIASYSESSSTASVDGPSVELTAVAGSYYSDRPSVMWTATAGTLSSPTSSACSYTCTAAGRQVITLTITDGLCPATATLIVTCLPSQDAATAESGTNDANRGEDGGIL